LGNITALRRDKDNDHPLIMFFELVGNDVCSPSIRGMTTPENFKENVLKAL
jgi:acyloxyacyl hydrolase